MSSRSDYEVDVRILSGEGGFTAEDVQDIADNLPRGVTVSDSAEPDANCDEYLCCAADRRSFSLRLEQIHPEDIELLLIELSKTHPSWLLLVEEMIFEQTNMAGAGRWRWLLAAGRKFEDLRQVVFYDHEMLEHFKVTEVLADPRSELGSPPFSLDTVRGWISAEMDGNDLPERFSNIRLKTEGGAIWRPVIRIGFEECDPPEPGDSA